MLVTLLENSIFTSRLRPVDHASLLVHRANDCAAVLKRDKDTCHVCGVRVPGVMEVDHTAGHTEAAKVSTLKAICPFCHALKHPLSSGHLQRFVPILCSEVTQANLHRLAWQMLGWRHNDGKAGEGVEILQDAMSTRHALFEERFESRDALPFFEAILGLKSNLPNAELMALVKKIDGSVRFWPTELLFGSEALPAASCLSTWSLGGFKRIGKIAAARAVIPVETDHGDLIAYAKTLMAA